jgi:hypothetical protein
MRGNEEKWRMFELECGASIVFSLLRSSLLNKGGRLHEVFGFSCAFCSTISVPAALLPVPYTMPVQSLGLFYRNGIP